MSAACRGEWRRVLLPELGALMLFCGLIHLVTSEQDCEYQYLRQPPTDITCNPYSNTAKLSMQCQVSVPLPLGSETRIQWFYDGEQITGTAFPPLLRITETEEIREEESVIISTVTLNGMEFSDDYSGDYYCQISVDGTDVSPSQTLSLQTEDEYIVFNPCREVEVEFVEEEACGRIVTIDNGGNDEVDDDAGSDGDNDGGDTGGGSSSSTPPPHTGVDTPLDPHPPISSSTSLPIAPAPPPHSVSIPGSSHIGLPPSTPSQTTEASGTSGSATERTQLLLYILIPLVVGLVLATVVMATAVGILCHRTRTKPRGKVRPQTDPEQNHHHHHHPKDQRRMDVVPAQVKLGSSYKADPPYANVVVVLESSWKHPGHVGEQVFQGGHITQQHSGSSNAP